MTNARRKAQTFAPDNAPLAGKSRRSAPYEFVLDALAPIEPRTRSMFGCLAVYVGEKVVFMLRDKTTETQDNGVWIATTEEHHAGLRREFPEMRSIQLFGGKISGWQVLPADAHDFEESAMRVCEMVLRRDPRIGKVPKSKQRAGRSS
jgi:hypothetical protein